MITNDYSFMTRLLNNTSTVRDQLAEAQTQIASGLISDTYAGLGSAQARTSLSLSPAITHQAALSRNIDTAQTRVEITQGAMSSISTIAARFLAQVGTYNPNDPNTGTTLAAEAKAALQQVGDLLNSKSGDVFVFAGADTSNAPVPNTDPNVMSAALLSSPPSSAPFSSTIGTSAPTVDVGGGSPIQVGLLANANTLAVSAPPTSGSYMRDTLTALAKIAGIPGSASPAADLSSARSTLSSAISAMASETGALGNIQANLETRQAGLSSLTNTLKKQLSSAQEVDQADAISRSVALQTQLQASYQIIANARNYSLANYL